MKRLAAVFFLVTAIGSGPPIPAANMPQQEPLTPHEAGENPREKDDPPPRTALPATTQSAPITPESNVRGKPLAGRPSDELRYPSQITPYDIMTAEDEFYYHHLSKLVRGGDVAEWPLVKTIVNLGADLLDAGMLAEAANGKINISEQKRAQAISQMVDECADILGIVPPPTYIEGNPFPNAYVTGLGQPHVLVLTSGLVELYAETPDELRFVIGHELGHIKSQHLRTLLVGRMVVFPLLATLRTEGLDSVTAIVANAAIKVTAFGMLMHWYREAEYTADRAGLICVGGRVDVAQQALMRLLHQTRQSNPLMNPDERGFDVQQLRHDQTDLRHRPMVQLFSYFYQFIATHPFISDRCVAVGNWAMSDHYQALMARRPLPPMTLQVSEIRLRRIPATDVYVPLVDSGETDPLVHVTYDGATRPVRREIDKNEVHWRQQDLRFPYVAGAGVIVDLYDYNTVLPNRLVGSVRVPVTAEGPGTYTVTERMALDIEEESTIVELPEVTIIYSLERLRSGGGSSGPESGKVPAGKE